jgi:PAS domain S-box-containing protein
VSEGDPLDLDEAAEGFEAREDTTSPEMLRARRHTDEVEENTPLAVIASRDVRVRDEFAGLLEADGWVAIGANGVDELLELARTRHPHVVLVDPSVRPTAHAPIPHLLRRGRTDVPMRVVAFLHSSATEEVAGAVADGYDDFVINPDNHVEVLARAAANLRACRSVAQLSKQKRDAASLLELSQALASSLDLQLILHTVSRLIAEVIDLERCSIVVLDPERDDAVMVAASEDRTVRDLRIKLASYPELKRCVSSAAPVLIEDTSKDPMLAQVQDTLDARAVRSMALFPIVFEERVTGVLFLRSTRIGRRFTDHEIQFGQTVASACAVAIRNARLFDSFRDQTERMNYMRIVAERQMEALKKYEDFFEYAADGMAIVDSDANILYVNREGRELLSRAEDDLRSSSFLSFLAEESRDRWPEIIDQVRHGRYDESFDLYVALPTGAERIFWLSAGGVGQDTGLMVLSFRDVTETREMELELRTTKEFLENLIDNSVDAIVAADMSGNIMLFNKGAEELYGYDADDVIGRLHVQDLYPEAVANEVMRQLRDDRWGGRGRLMAQRKAIVSAAGQTVPVSMTASLIYEDGEEVATVGVLSDLRDRLKIERRLSEAQEELMHSEKARVAAQLAGMAAHELNQPLTSVLGYAEMLRHRVSEEDSKLRKHIETIFEQAERMAKIVRKIGRITRYETKHYGGGSEIVDLDKASEPEDTDKNKVVRESVTDEGMVKRPSPGPLGMFQARAVGKGKAAVDPASIVRPDTVDDDAVFASSGEEEVTAPRNVDVTGRMRPSRPKELPAPPRTDPAARPPRRRSTEQDDNGAEMTQGFRPAPGPRDISEEAEVTNPGKPMPKRPK